MGIILTHGFTPHAQPCCPEAGPGTALSAQVRCGGPGRCASCRRWVIQIHTGQDLDHVGAMADLVAALRRIRDHVNQMWCPGSIVAVTGQVHEMFAMVDQALALVAPAAAGVDAGRENMLRRQLADLIERELVCCDIYEKINALPAGWRGDLRKEFGRTYHDICHWGGYAAALVASRRKPKSLQDRPWLVILKATSATGMEIHTGPVDMAEALTITDSYLAPNQWTPQYLTYRSRDEAANHFTASPQQEPFPYADFHIALRRAVFTSIRYDGFDDPSAQAVVAAAESHRPVIGWGGDQDCLDGDCDHQRTTAGRCVTVKPVVHLCTTCSVAHDDGSEWSPVWLEPCQVTWPCTPLTNIATFFKVALPVLPAQTGDQ